MKNSGIEWIGEIPDSWSCLKAKYGIQSNDGGVWGNDLVGDENDKVVFRSTEQTIDGKWSIDNPAKRNFTFDISYYKILPGDLLITKSSGSLLHIGKTTLADSFFETNECYYSNFLQRIRLKAVFLPKYAWYLFNSILVREQFIYIQNSTSGLGNITASNIENIFVPLPLLKQQQQIVCFLDSRMEKIDALIEIQQAQIEKLKEYKQSVITEAVTKGIDPNVPMKDSGVDWIGQVPVHWVKVRHKALFTNVSIKDCGYATVLSLYRDYGVIPKDSRDDNYNVTSVDTNSYKFVAVDDLVINKMKAWSGSLAISDYEGIVSPAYYICKVNYNYVTKHFIHYYLRNRCLVQLYAMLSAGLRIGQWDLSIEDFQSIEIIIPPTLKEQECIVEYIDKRCSNIDRIIDIKQSKIEKLQKYKKSLIYEYVTGKKEVV